MRARMVIATALLLSGLAGGVIPGMAADASAEDIGRTPPRLAYVDGRVSFWRPGAEDWTAAQVNTPLATGDELYTASPGTLEIQIGSRSYARASAETGLGLAGLEPDYLQLKVTTGHVALDIRRLDPGQSIEVDTPYAAFTVEHPGYYRVDVVGERTSFITRRGGRATVTLANGSTSAIAPSEEVVLEGTAAATVATYVAPEVDDWDRWNYARSDALSDAVSARYVSPGVYGADELDHHGSWRVVERYGSVWIPEGVPGGWVPYSTGTWVWDPLYGWTWVDTAPWGWAPYHYGRWVFVDGVWAWAPGPVVARPVYAPALVAFFGGAEPDGPAVGWVPLGWGEPVIPWWGPAGFVGAPWWGGWGGPRIVNNVVVHRTTIVKVTNITVYRNASVHHAMVVVPRHRFGRAAVPHVRLAQVDPRRLAPVHGSIGVQPVRTSLTPDTARGITPPAVARRSIVATRAPADPSRWLTPHGLEPPPAAEGMRPRLVKPPAREPAALVAPRPPFGASAIERPRPPVPPRFGMPPAGQPAPAPPAHIGPPSPEGGPPHGRVTLPAQPAIPAAPARPLPAPGAPPRVEGVPAPPRGDPRAGGAPAGLPGVRGTPPTAREAPPAAREAPYGPPVGLPGEPANRLFPGRAETGASEPRGAQRMPPQPPAPPAQGGFGTPMPAR
ncbi:MAG TPA: DUF6600 domain-containing protein [Methylomirabilota bacterium]|nr:DUF6600 domain-containing protein [Methylomirabilota bacterium]